MFKHIVIFITYILKRFFQFRGSVYAILFSFILVCLSLKKKKRNKTDLKDCLNLMPRNSYSIVRMGSVECHSQPIYMGHKCKSNIEAKTLLILTKFNSFQFKMAPALYLTAVVQ